MIHKLLFTELKSLLDAALQEIRDLLEVAVDQLIPADRIAAIKMEATVATNTLLERKGDRTLLLMT